MPLRVLPPVLALGLLTLAACGGDRLPEALEGARDACLIADDPVMVRDELWTEAAPARGEVIFRFVQLSDEHILDDDGQALLGTSVLDPVASLFSSAQRMQDEYSDEVLNRMVATINGCHARAPIELVITTGDNTDLATVGELRRLIDNLDGSFDRVSHFEQQCRARFPEATPEAVLEAACTRLTGRGTPDSQTVDPDPENPLYQVPATRTVQQLADTELAVTLGRDAEGGIDPARSTLLRAPGLPEVLRCEAGAPGCENLRLEVPYYIAFGNHDGYLRGTIATLPAVVEAYAVVGRALFDTRREFIDELFVTSELPGPVGHGFQHVEPERFDDDNPRNDGYYAFDAAGGAVRMIVLDTIIDGTMPGLPEIFRNPFALSDGTVDEVQFAWMQDQLVAAGARGQLAFVFSHHPDLSFSELGVVGALAPKGVPVTQFNAELARHPHLIAWIAGHTHRHRVRAFKVTDGVGSNGVIEAPVDCPEETVCHGFWQIESASLIDHPQEARLIEVVNHGDGSGSLRLRVLQHDFERSQRLAEADDRCQFFLEDPGALLQVITDADISAICTEGGSRVGEPGDRNVDLRFRWPEVARSD